MPAETAPNVPDGQPESSGVNPGDFRTPLPYEVQVIQDEPTPVTPIEVRHETSELPAEPEPVSAASGESPIEVERSAEYERYARGVRDAGVPPPSFETWQRVHHPEDAVEELPPPEPEPGVRIEPVRDEPESEPVAPEPGPEPAPEPTPLPETIPPAGDEESPESDEEPPEDLAPERRSGFRALPEQTRSRFGNLYRRLQEMPATRRIVGKLEIAYHQHFLDRDQEQSVGLKTRLDIVDARLEGLEEARREIEADIADIRVNGDPCAEALQMSLQKLDKTRAKIMAERDKAQTAFEAVDNKAKLRATKRDAVADRLITTYDQELLPLETELEALQTARDQMELIVAITEVKHEELTARAERLQERRDHIAELLRRSGASEKDIRQATASFDERVLGIAEEISRDRESIATRKLAIDERVARVDAAANPYRDKREEFVRVKNSRPIDIEVATRTREAAFEGKTPTIGHTRRDAEGAAGPGAETGPPTTESDPRPDVSAYVSQWNEHLASKDTDGAARVEVADLAKAGVREAQKLNPAAFKKILAAYLKFRKVPQEQYTEALKDFLPAG